MTKTEGVLREDHFLFTSNDIKHDILFAKLCNDMIHTYYDKVSVDIATWILSLMMYVLANLNTFVQYNALPQEKCDAYVSNLKLIITKVNLMGWVVL